MTQIIVFYVNSEFLCFQYLSISVAEWLALLTSFQEIRGLTLARGRVQVMTECSASLHRACKA